MNSPSGLICGSCTARIPNRSSTVIRRGPGACRAATRELAEPTRHSKTARRAFMRVNLPGKNEYECGTGQFSTAKMCLWRPGAPEPAVTPSTLAETAGVVGKYGWLAEKSFAEMHFPLARACRACILQKVDLLGLI